MWLRVASRQGTGKIGINHFHCLRNSCVSPPHSSVPLIRLGTTSWARRSCSKRSENTRTLCSFAFQMSDGRDSAHPLRRREAPIPRPRPARACPSEFRHRRWFLALVQFGALRQIRMMHRIFRCKRRALFPPTHNLANAMWWLLHLVAASVTMIEEIAGVLSRLWQPDAGSFLSASTEDKWVDLTFCTTES